MNNVNSGNSSGGAGGNSAGQYHQFIHLHHDRMVMPPQQQQGGNSGGGGGGGVGGPNHTYLNQYAPATSLASMQGSGGVVTGAGGTNPPNQQQQQQGAPHYQLSIPFQMQPGQQQLVLNAAHQGSQALHHHPLQSGHAGGHQPPHVMLASHVQLQAHQANEAAAMNMRPMMSIMPQGQQHPVIGQPQIGSVMTPFLAGPPLPQQQPQAQPIKRERHILRIKNPVTGEDVLEKMKQEKLKAQEKSQAAALIATAITITDPATTPPPPGKKKIEIKQANEGGVKTAAVSRAIPITAPPAEDNTPTVSANLDNPDEFLPHLTKVSNVQKIQSNNKTVPAAAAAPVTPVTIVSVAAPTEAVKSDVKVESVDKGE